MRIRVARDDGLPVTFATGLLRDFLFKMVLGFFTAELFSLSTTYGGCGSGEKRALHDLVASTHVVRT